MKPPIIAIVGRANVGKSTLFNRLSEASKALTSPIPGTTRDRAEADCFWRGKIVRVVDTGGVNLRAVDAFDRDIREQAKLAIKEADVILFLVDVQAGITPDDRELSRQLRQSKKPVIVVGNKADNARWRSAAASQSWKGLGFDLPHPIAAHQGVGVGDLLDEVWPVLKKIDRPPADVSEVATTRIIVIGTPNVGKSSLLNAILKTPRFIVSPVAHTTREPNDTAIEVDGRRYILIDTAGIRKLAGVKKRGGLELAGVAKTLHLLPRADVAVLVLDVTADIGQQEKRLAERIIEARTGAVIVANKWDLVPDKTPTTQNEYTRYLADVFPMLTFAPVLFTSALSGQHVTKIFGVIDHIQNERYKQIDEEVLDEFIKRMIKRHLPSRHKGIKHPQILRFRQVAVAPPEFVLTVKGKRADVLHPSYLRFLENRLREEFGFDGTPIQIHARAERKKV